MDSKPTALFILLSVMFFTCASSPKMTSRPKGHSFPAVVPKQEARCPKDALKYGVCGSWLGLVHEVIGSKPSEQCCALIEGLAELEAAVCLCTAIKANVLGVIKMDVPVALSLVVNSCGKKVPDGFVCP